MLVIGVIHEKPVSASVSGGGRVATGQRQNDGAQNACPEEGEQRHARRSARLVSQRSDEFVFAPDADGAERAPGAGSSLVGSFADASPFCVDVFALGDKGSEHPGHLVFLGKNAPDAGDVSARWLLPGKKQSRVLVIVSPDTMTTRSTLITYPDGFGGAPDDGGNYVQDFYQGGVGGGKILYDFGVDARGMMTVVNTNRYADRTQSTTVLSWNGHAYAARPQA